MPTRRTFFAAAAVSTLALDRADEAAVAETPTPYDFAALEMRLGRPVRHRQAFSTHRLADGIVAGLMLNSLNAYEFDYGEGPGSLHALGIWYGSSVAMLLDDAAWRTYKIALVQQRRGDPAKHDPAGANPYLSATSPLDRAAARSDVHGLYHDASLTALRLRGATFLACDNALRGLATDIAVSYNFSDRPLAAVHADIRRHLIPGTLLVPAGVAAVNQAQERKFTLLPASL